MNKIYLNPGSKHPVNFLVTIFPLILLVLYSCNQKPEPESLPLSVIENLNYLQDNAQFVMYINFKNMRRTDFWKTNISDSILNEEKTFGSLLYTFRLATGASITEGIDELYYSNSWFGENSIVMKGVLDRNKLREFISSDTLFSVAKNYPGKTIYQKNDNGLYFYFKDDNTICASNYLKQIDYMLNVSDTAKSGILLNQNLYDAINSINYKQEIWMVTTEKTFIRGIFLNFIESTTGKRIQNENSETEADSTDSGTDDKSGEKINAENLYKNINSISFSTKMSSDLKILLQCECDNENTSNYLRSLINGFVTVAKLSSAGKNKNSVSGILDKLHINRYDNSVFLDLEVNESNINELRKIKLLAEPEE